MKVLIIDNTIDPDCWGSADLRRFAHLMPGATFHIRRAPANDLPPSPTPYDKIVVSGSKTSAMDDSPWVGRLHEFIRTSINEGKPYLGVCYGHQSLVRALDVGSKEQVRKGAEAEFGWTRIDVLGKSALFEGLPKSFYSFSSHFEEVSSLPTGLKKLARSEACEIQACELEGKPVFGIQFHPEKNIQDAEKTFSERRKIGEPKKLLHPEGSQKLYDPEVGLTLFKNFFKL